MRPELTRGYRSGVAVLTEIALLYVRAARASLTRKIEVTGGVPSDERAQT